MSYAYIDRGCHVSRFPTGDMHLSCECMCANRILRLAHVTGYLCISFSQILRASSSIVPWPCSRRWARCVCERTSSATTPRSVHALRPSPLVLSLSLFFYLYLSIYLSIYLSLSLYIYIYICIYLYINKFVPSLYFIPCLSLNGVKGETKTEK